MTTDPSGLLDLGKVERGIWGILQGEIEFLSSAPATTVGTANVGLMAKGYADFLLGIKKTVEGLRGEPGLGAPASVAEGVVDAVSLGLTGERSQTARDLIDVADSMFSGAASGYLRGAAARGPNTYRMYPSGQVQAAVARSAPDGSFYSVAFQTELRQASYPGVSRAAHFQEANESLLRMMEGDAQFAQSMRDCGISLERTATGLAPRTSPAGWSWHHAQEPGIMQLVPHAEHTAGSVWSETLHPGGQGGYSVWGK